MNGIVGRKSVQDNLEKLYKSGKPELLIVYGRRRVGKTYLDLRCESQCT
jgi:AAA+ ATPase superfamily predicted ATPase